MTLNAILVAISFLPFFEAKNVSANYLVNPPAEGESVSVERPELVVREACPACKGKGEITLQEQDFGTANRRLGANQKKRVTCAVCKGRKRLEMYASPDALLADVSRDWMKFESDHRGRGDVSVGEAFLPREDYERVKDDKKLLKLIEKAYGAPCKTCNWTGLESCKECDGEGIVKCTNDDCKGGWAVVRSGMGGGSTSGRRSSRKNSEENGTISICPTCGGAAMVRCPECQGRRARTCKKCKGLGTKRKGGS